MQPTLFSERELNTELHRFAKTLKAPDDYRQFGLKMCRKVVNRLSVALIDGEDVDFEIHASHIGGTLVRETDVLVPEFDLVIHVEELAAKLFNMTYFLDLISEILKRNRGDLKIIYGSIEKCTYGIKFMFEKGIVVYLWPLTYEDQSQDGELTDHVKRIEMIEAREAFMREQSPFTHDVVRLAKFWFQSKAPYFLGIEETTRGATIHLMEMISVAAALEVEEKCENVEAKGEVTTFRNGSLAEEPKMLHAMDKVLKMLKNLGSLKLMFAQAQQEMWHSTPKGQRIVLKKVSRGKWTLYPMKRLNMIPSFSADTCFLKDPTNSNFDLLQHFNPTVTSRLGNFASRSLQWLAKFQNNSYTIRYGGRQVIEFAEMFEPAPPNKKFLHFPKEYSISFDDNYPFEFVYLEVENPVIFGTNYSIRTFTYIMKNNLHLVIKSVMGQGLTWKELGPSIERAVRGYGKRNLPSEVKLLHNVDHYEHPSDVNIYIPYGRDTEKTENTQPPGNRALRFAMSW